MTSDREGPVRLRLGRIGIRGYRLLTIAGGLKMLDHGDQAAIMAAHAVEDERVLRRQAIDGNASAELAKGVGQQALIPAPPRLAKRRPTLQHQPAAGRVVEQDRAGKERSKVIVHAHVGSGSGDTIPIY